MKTHTPKEHAAWLKDNMESLRECFRTAKEGRKLSQDQMELLDIHYHNHWCGTCADTWFEGK